MQQQMGMQKERIGMDRERLGMERQRFDTQQQMATVQRFAGLAQGIDKITDPAQRQAQWQQLLSQHPNAAQLPEIYRDPMQGPRLLMQEAQGFRGPDEEAKLGLTRAQTTLAQAQAEKARREASGSLQEYGKAGSVFQGQDGKFYTIQFGSRGERKILPVEVGGQALSPSRGVMQIGDELADKSTGATVRNVGPQIAGEAGQKVVGRETAELQFTQPKARAALEAANAKVSVVLDKIKQIKPLVSNWSVGPGSYLAALPATQARDLAALKTTIEANLGFDELQEMRANSPTGGALGAIAVQELQMLVAAKANLDQAQTVDQFNTALGQLEQVYAGAVARRQKAFEETYAPLQGRREPRQFQDRLPQGGPPQAGSQGMIPPQAVQLLRSNPAPEIIQQFEAKYGPGSARQFMGGQ
jgi:hypothetical protein